MDAALTLLECAAAALCLAGARWFWLDAPSFRRRGLAGGPPPREEDEEPPPYVVVGPAARRANPKRPAPAPADLVQP